MADSQMRFDTPVSLLTQITNYAHTELVIRNVNSFTIIPSNDSRRPPPYVLYKHFKIQCWVNQKTIIWNKYILWNTYNILRGATSGPLEKESEFFMCTVLSSSHMGGTPKYWVPQEEDMHWPLAKCNACSLQWMSDFWVLFWLPCTGQKGKLSQLLMNIRHWLSDKTSEHVKFNPNSPKKQWKSHKEVVSY